MKKDPHMRETDLHSVPLRVTARPRAKAGNSRKENALILSLMSDPRGPQDGGLSRGAVKFIAVMSCWAVSLLLAYVYMQVHCTNMGYKNDKVSRQVSTLSVDCEEVQARLTANETWNALEPKALDMGLVVDTGEAVYLQVPPRKQEVPIEVFTQKHEDDEPGILQRLAQRLKGLPRSRQGES